MAIDLALPASLMALKLVVRAVTNRDVSPISLFLCILHLPVDLMFLAYGLTAAKLMSAETVDNFQIGIRLTIVLGTIFFVFVLLVAAACRQSEKSILSKNNAHSILLGIFSYIASTSCLVFSLELTTGSVALAKVL